MMTCSELFGFMSSNLSNEILEHAYNSDRALYKTVLTAVAEAMKLRPAFFERQPRQDRHRTMLEVLARPRFEEVSGNLLGTWLLKSETSMLADFLDTLKVTHNEGVVQDFPKKVEDAALHAAVDKILASHSQEKVIVYLNALCSINHSPWKNLETMLREDPRLQFA
ncbi:MAG: hypothetical protein K9N62_05055 [Verrucomicrobia bacterium]|nr:hypothetical protein [Verrucomicrobiota bacterium]